MNISPSLGGNVPLAAVAGTPARQAEQPVYFGFGKKDEAGQAIPKRRHAIKEFVHGSAAGLFGTFLAVLAPIGLVGSAATSAVDAQFVHKTEAVESSHIHAADNVLKDDAGKTEDPAPYYAELNEALKANGVNKDLPDVGAASYKLTKQEQIQTLQLLDKMTHEKNWESNWQAQYNNFRDYLDGVLVPGNHMTQPQADQVKDLAKSVFNGTDSYDNFHGKLTLVRWGSMLGSGLAAMFLIMALIDFMQAARAVASEAVEEVGELKDKVFGDD